MSTPTMPPLMPAFSVSDVKASIDWFGRLGFICEGEMAMPDGSIMHAEVVRGPLRFMLGPAQDGNVGSAGLSLYATLDDGIDAYYGHVRAAGVTISQEIQDQFWGDRTFSVTHPDGYHISFAQKVRDVSIEEMQAHMKEMAPA